MIFTKKYAFTSDEQVEVLYREYNINYRAFGGSFIYILSKIVDSCFAVHNLEKFSSNPGKLYSEVLLHFLRYIRANKNLGLKYYYNI